MSATAGQPSAATRKLTRKGDAVSSSTGFCRVTVVAPDGRTDVALPEDIPLADIWPELLRLTGPAPARGGPGGLHLVRRDGTVLDSGLPLIAQQVHDGELLSLRPFADSLPGPVYDDVADALARAVGAERGQWSPELLRACALTGSVLLLALLGLTLWAAAPGHATHSLPGLVSALTALLLTALAGVRARVYDDPGSALALGLAALPHALIGGSGLLAAAPGQGPGRIQLLTGCVTVLVVSVLLTVLIPGGDAPFVAAVLLSATGTAATFAAILGGVPARATAAVASVAAVALLGFLPQLAARLARLPVAFPPARQPGDTGDTGEAEPADTGPADCARIAARARRGHELLGGLVGGCAAVVAVGAAVLARGGGRWPELLVLALGVAVTLRARLFRRTAQVLCLLGSGAIGTGVLIVTVALHAHRLAPAAPVALGAAVLTVAALTVPAGGLPPFRARALDLLDGLALAALIPLALAVLDVYARVRALTG